MAVDVKLESTPNNLQNIQTHPLWKMSTSWKPKSYTLLDNRILHTEHDPEIMTFVPVLQRRGEKTLLIDGE